MDTRKPARSGAERQRQYKARLAASGEQPVDRLALAALAEVLAASRSGDSINPAIIIERATASVLTDPRFTAEGVDNVLARVCQPVSRAAARMKTTIDNLARDVQRNLDAQATAYKRSVVRTLNRAAGIHQDNLLKQFASTFRAPVPFTTRKGGDKLTLAGPAWKSRVRSSTRSRRSPAI